jgi:hypothetical protein
MGGMNGETAANGGLNKGANILLKRKIIVYNNNNNSI